MYISEKLLWFFGNFFGKKIRLFAGGQKDVFDKLKSCSLAEKKTIWMHVSSLGEYEQGLPVIEQLKKQYPQYQIVLSFFSPSGYEVMKDKAPADCVVYLPVATRKNARKFLDMVHPEIVFFVKYDFWPNYLLELQKRKIPAFLISGLFPKNHRFFKKHNAWLKKTLRAFHTFFVQDENSKEQLKKNGFSNAVVTGDTRFDRVWQIVKNNPQLDFVEKFKQDKLLFIAGSTWAADEKFSLPYINHTKYDFKTILAPHQIDKSHIKAITKTLKVNYVLYTDITDDTDLSKYKVLIMNVIGVLNKTYKYADVVYVGNGFGKSIHNIQEPAVFGVPVITGPHISKFKEAVDLHRLKALSVINKASDFDRVMNALVQDEKLRRQKAEITRNYVMKNVGATQKIMNYLSDFL